MTEKRLIEIREVNKWLEQLQKKDPELILILDTSEEDSDWLHKK